MTQHLLIIEDDVRLAGMVAEYLEQNAFKVGHAPTGQIGLDLLSNKLSASPAYDLVILDLMLPDMGGSVQCSNRPEGGASFSLRLPL